MYVQAILRNNTVISKNNTVPQKRHLPTETDILEFDEEVAEQRVVDKQDHFRHLEKGQITKRLHRTVDNVVVIPVKFQTKICLVLRRNLQQNNQNKTSYSH